MKNSLTALCGVLTLASALAVPARAAGIEGDYVEARTADVFTGPCFSNAEVFVYGSQAVMAWKVNQGSFDGVDLRGLSVAAAVQGTTTFSEDKAGAARSVVIVDEKADARQREALVAMARKLGGDRLRNVVSVKAARISMKVEAETHSASASATQVAHDDM